MKYYLCELLAIIILLVIAITTVLVVDSVIGKTVSGDVKFIIGFFIGITTILLGYYPLKEHLWFKYGD